MFHIHEWSKWEDVGAIDTFFHTSGAIIQTTTCELCGKRKLRKTNSVSCSEVNTVQHILAIFITSSRRLNNER